MKRNTNIHEYVRDADEFREFRAGQRKPTYYSPKTDNTLQFVLIAIAIMGVGATACGLLLLNNAGVL